MLPCACICVCVYVYEPVVNMAGLALHSTSDRPTCERWRRLSGWFAANCFSSEGEGEERFLSVPQRAICVRTCCSLTLTVKGKRIFGIFPPPISYCTSNSFNVSCCCSFLNTFSQRLTPALITPKLAFFLFLLPLGTLLVLRCCLLAA